MVMRYLVYLFVTIVFLLLFKLAIFLKKFFKGKSQSRMEWRSFRTGSRGCANRRAIEYLEFSMILAFILMSKLQVNQIHSSLFWYTQVGLLSSLDRISTNLWQLHG